MAALLGVASVPLIFLFARLPAAGIGFEWSSFARTLGFAVGAAAVSTTVGTAIGILTGTREFPGRRWLLCVSVAPIAAPPAFWWIGAARLTPSLGSMSGPVSGAVVGGLALSPVVLLLVVAALRQLPSNLYDAARVALPPAVRRRAVLLRLLYPAILGGFVLTVILLLGESEIPFLFGFRTVMTDVVTMFSQTFDARQTVPLVLPLVLAIFLLGSLAARSLMSTIMVSSRGNHGVVRRRASSVVMLCAALPCVALALSIGGYVWAIAAARPVEWPRVPMDLSTVAISVVEPVACAWVALGLTLLAAYPARRSRVMPYFLWIGLLLFCIPSAIYAIGWLSVGQLLGGLAVPAIVAHTSRAVPVASLGFFIGYSRLPTALEDAATLVAVSSLRRAVVFVLPLIAGSLMAASALVAALTYADRDVASLLLPPGASRLTLNLYLASANAPSSTVGGLALLVLAGAAVTIGLAAAGPAVLWGRRA